MSNPSPSQVTLLQGYTSYLSAAKTFDNGGNLYAVYYDKSLETKQVTTMSMNSAGTIAWATNQPLTGTSGEDIDPAIVLDNAGGVYVAFTSLGTVYNPNTSTGKQDITIIKYNSGGVQQWIRQRSVDISMNTVENDLNPSLTYDAVNGALYVTYETTGATTPIGDKDVVMIKLTTAGVKLWERVMGTVAEDTSAQITADMCGNLVIVYNTKGVTNTTETKTSTTGYDVAIAKYDTNGNLLWRRQNNTFNTTGNNLAPVATTDANGNIFCAYCVSGGTISGGSNAGGYDLVAFKLNAAGTLQWARQANMWNTAANDLEPSITVDSNGYLYLAYTSLGAIAGKTNSGGTDIIVLKIDDRSGGNLVWAKQNTLNNTAYNEFQPTVRTGGFNQVFVGYLSDATDASGYTDFGILNIVDPAPSTTNILAPGPAGQPTGLAAGESALTWTGPGGTVTSYKLYNVSGDLYTLFASLPSSSTSVEYASLRPTLNSTIWMVTAVNDNGESMYSLPVSRQIALSDVTMSESTTGVYINELLSNITAADGTSDFKSNLAAIAEQSAPALIKLSSAINANILASTVAPGVDLSGREVAVIVAATGDTVTLDSAQITQDTVLYIPTSVTLLVGSSSYDIVVSDSTFTVNGVSVALGEVFMLDHAYIRIFSGSAGLLRVPDAPTNVGGIAGDQSVSLSWTAPSDIGGATSVTYTITAKNQNGDVISTVSGISGTTYTYTGLTNGTAYTFTVVAVNDNGAGAAATSSSVTPASVVATSNPPGVPRNVSASSVTSTGMRINWLAPNTGGAVTSYTVTNVTTGASATVTGALYYTATGLTADTSYVFSVSATNADGTSGSVSIMQKTAVASTPPSGGGGSVPCFLANAPVLTPSGYQKISHLAVGELVVTGDGRHVPVQRVKVTKVAAGPDTNPYVIERGQFGAVRRLLISPNHKVVTDNGAVEAKDLGLKQEERDGTLTYYNIELPDYGRDTMVVAGVVVESLAPVRRMVVTMDQFATVMHQKYGANALSAPVMNNILRTCRILADGRVEVPVLRR